METGTIALIISIVALLIVGILSAFLLKKSNRKSAPEEGKDSTPVDGVEDLQEESPADLTEVLSEAVSIEFLPALIQGQEETGLVFEKIDDSEGKLYKEIILSGASQASGAGMRAGAVVGQQMFSMQQLAAQAPNGLFAATTDPATLTRFADGTVSTMVHGESGIASHYGFEQVKGISAINPAMVVSMGMQAMAFVSGQYYLKRISERMNRLESKVEQLMLYQKAEKIGDLKNAWEMLRKITSREVVDDHDLDQIIRIIEDAGKVYEQYKILVDQKLKELKRFTGKGGIAEERLDEYRQEILELQEYLEICFIADQLKLKAEVAEIAVRRRINLRDPKLSELLVELKSDITDSFSCNTCEDFDSFSSPILKRAEMIGMHHRGLGKALKSLFRGSETVSEELLEPVREQVNKMKGSLDSLVESEMYKKALASGEEKQGILLMPGSKGMEQRIFVEIPEEA